ncbi:MAG TPA: uroporphyrinogen-III synthase [Gammaproteobacteria bacterium]|nr:uroporphyrinogen-III synthase [Gammaproteobacteria bacterium]
MSDDVRNVFERKLAGVRVILTRPKQQCDALIDMLGQRGAEARCLPVIEIEPPPDAAPATDALENLGRFDLVVFTSANAVGGALLLKPDLADIAALPEVATVGPATRRALERAGISVAIIPGEEFSSEGLLRHPRLQKSVVQGKRVLIVKGVGGRGLLADGLRAAGAKVSSVDVYRRSRPEGRIPELLGEPLTGFDLIVLTSGTAIEHLLDIASDEERRRILDMPMLVSSRRIARILRGRGARRPPLVAEGPEDEVMVRAIERWRRSPAEKS